MKMIGVITGANEFQAFIMDTFKDIESYTVYGSGVAIDYKNNIKYIRILGPNNMRGIDFDDIIVYGSYKLRASGVLEQMRMEANNRLARIGKRVNW